MTLAATATAFQQNHLAVKLWTTATSFAQVRLRTYVDIERILEHAIIEITMFASIGARRRSEHRQRVPHEYANVWKIEKTKSMARNEIAQVTTGLRRAR